MKRHAVFLILLLEVSSCVLTKEMSDEREVAESFEEVKDFIEVRVHPRQRVSLERRFAKKSRFKQQQGLLLLEPLVHYVVHSLQNLAVMKDSGSVRDEGKERCSFHKRVLISGGSWQ